MNTTISSKGQLVIPSALRRKLRLNPGDQLSARVEGGALVLVPQRRRVSRGRITTDKRTGLAVVKAPAGARKVTSEEIHALLADFP